MMEHCWITTVDIPCNQKGLKENERSNREQFAVESGSLIWDMGLKDRARASTGEENELLRQEWYVIYGGNVIQGRISRAENFVNLNQGPKNLDDEPVQHGHCRYGTFEKDF